jgi:hypothetical protein
VLPVIAEIVAPQQEQSKKGFNTRRRVPVLRAPAFRAGFGALLLRKPAKIALAALPVLVRALYIKGKSVQGEYINGNDDKNTVGQIDGRED